MYPSPHLSINPSLDMTSLGNVLLLKIGMTHLLSGLRVRTLTINSGDIPIRTCSGTYPFAPLKTKLGHICSIKRYRKFVLNKIYDWRFMFNILIYLIIVI